MVGKTPKKGRKKSLRKGRPNNFSNPPWVQIARSIHYARKKLRRLLDQARTGTPLSDFEKKTAVNLRREIHMLKAKLLALGKDPDVVAGVVAKSLQNKTKTRHGKYRRSGVGAYPLGGTIKNWR